MMVVMLVLAAATASAVFAVHTTSYELRAAGYQRQTMQADYASETALHSALAMVNAIDPKIIEMLRSDTDTSVDSCANEPDLPEDGVRLSITSFEDVTGNSPLDREALGGDRQSYEPYFFVCVYDIRDQQFAEAGESLTTTRQRQTYTAYSFLRLDLDDDPTNQAEDKVVATDEVGDYQREYHEVTNSARAHAITAPITE
ncbi:MAG: hypothetical protein KC416_00245 [Myxococcales bacterium]|nr:hypothetical protein [Myxococcales bacterium]